MQALDIKNISALTFDLDQTLFDRGAAMRAYLIDWLARHGLEPEPALLERALEVDRMGYAPRRTFHQWWCGEMFDRGVTLTMDALWEDFKANLARHAQLAPEVEAMLTALSARLPLALITNGGAENQRAKIAQLGLERFFPAERIIVSDEVGSWKPEPEIFCAALTALGDPDPKTVMHVGDDPVNDIAGAAQVGMSTCWVALERTFPGRVPGDVKPALTISQTSDLMEIFS